MDYSSGFLDFSSEEACKASREHTFSVIYGDDLVPRLSIQTMQELKCSVLSVIEQNKHPKVGL